MVRTSRLWWIQARVTRSDLGPMPPNGAWESPVDVGGGKFLLDTEGRVKPTKARAGIFRANIEIPPGQTPAHRRDIELLYDGLPEPIDLEIDPATRTLYWTDRGDPPRGNSVSRAPLDAPTGKRLAPEIVFDHLMEGIGLALDHKGGRMFITDLGGSVYSADLDGSNRRMLEFAVGNLTGIAYAELPVAQ